jgi:hypothetical protein
MNKINWTQVAVFGLVVLLVVLLGVSLLGGYAAWGPGWGMMGPGMMGGWGRGWGFGPFGWMGIFMLLFPLGFLALLILGILWLVKAVAPSGGQAPAVPGRTCPNCGRSVQADWQLCPYCGQKLTP